ncbi:MAG TPA: VOC family protein [Candidatus Limnocylindrales bacterium]|nr:VOC family protein [Candidatus Limnocylindrales bacterium]
MPELDAIGIVSADLKESMRFYRLVGLQVPDTTEDHIEAVTRGGVRVMFDALELMKQLDPDWVQPAGRPIGLAFRCINAKEVDEVYARVVAAGFRGKAPPFDAFWGQRYATVLDPDGNGVDLFAELPKDR